MNDTEIRERLLDLAAEAPQGFAAPPQLLRRARRRVALVVTSSAMIVLAIVVGGIAGGRWLAASDREPAAPPTSPRPELQPSPAALGALAYGIDGDIYVADWDGSNAVRIADGRPPNDCGVFDYSGEYWGEGPIWSPDGRYLAYRHRNCAVEDLPTDRPPDDVWGDVVISDPEGNVIASFPAGTGWDIGWSPDSTRVAVWVRFGGIQGRGTIGVYELDGERQALLTVPPGTLSGDQDPVWLPDGQSLLVNDVLVVPIDGSTPYRFPLADRGPAEGTSATYSPDGSRVAYVDDRSVVVAEADGSNPQVVFRGDVAQLAGSPVWSPAGDRIAFTSNRVSGGSQLRVLDLATGTVTLLAEADGSDQLAVIDFSPEGDRIHFSRMKDGRIGVGSLWSVNVDGSDLRRLVNGTAWGDWFSPDQIDKEE
jgi:Tol biopolymer transport system component